MAATNELKVVISGDASSAMGVLKQFSGAVKGTTSEVEGHFSSLSKVVENFAAPIAAIAAALGGGALFKGAIDGAVSFGKEVGQIQRTLGVTSTEASATALAVRSVFGDTDGFLNAAAKMVKTLSSNEEAIKKLGVATRDSNGQFRSAPELIADINAALGKKTEGIERDMAANSVYGRSWREMLKYVALTPEVMAEARIRAHELGLDLDQQSSGVIKKYRQAMVGVTDDFEAMKVRVSLQVMPALTNLANWFSSVAPAAINGFVSLLRSMGDFFSMTTVQVGLLALALRGLFSSAMISGLSNLATALKDVFGAMVLGTTGPLTALGTKISSLLNPVTLMVAGIAAWAVALEWVDRAGERAHNRAMQEINDHTKQVSTLRDLQKEYAELARRLDSGKLAGDAKAQALKNLKAIQEQIVAVAPEYRTILEKERESYVAIADAIKKANAEKKKDLESQLARMDGELKQAEERLNRMSADDKSGNRFDKSAGEGETGAVIVGVDSLRKAGERVHFLTQEVNALREALGRLNSDTSSASGSGGGGSDAGTSAFEKFRADLAQAKYEFEAASLANGKLTEWTKAQEAEWIAENASNTKKYGFSANERLQVDRMLLDARRAVFAQGHKSEMDSIKEGMAALKHDAEARLALAQEMEAKAANPEEAAQARKEQERIRQEILDQNRKLQEIDLESTKSHNLAMLQEEEDSLKALKDERWVSDLEYLDQIGQIQERRYQIERDALVKRLMLGNLEKTEQARIFAEIQTLDDRRNIERNALNQDKSKEKEKVNGGLGAETAIKEYLDSSRNAFANWKGFATSILGGTENAFANFFESLTQKGQTMGQKMKALWSGISQSVVGALAKIAAQEVVTWAIQKGKLAWDMLRSAWGTADTVKSVAQSGAKSAANTTEAGTSIVGATANIFKAHSSIPWVGVAIAAGMVLAMMAVFNSIKARAVGGLVNKPEITLLGEAGPEVVAPEHDFKHWAKGLQSAGVNLGLNLAAHDARISQINSQASGYASTAMATGGGMGHTTQDFRGSTIVTVDSRQWAEMVQKGIKTYGRSNG